MRETFWKYYYMFLCFSIKGAKNWNINSKKTCPRAFKILRESQQNLLLLMYVQTYVCVLLSPKNSLTEPPKTIRKAQKWFPNSLDRLSGIYQHIKLISNNLVRYT